jgi:hypothetical protein
MKSTVKKTDNNNEKKLLQKEIVNVLLKKTGVTLDDLYTSARKRFVASNLDLLTASEKKKFDSILLY